MDLHNETRLIAVGDIALNGLYEDLLRRGKAHEVFARVAHVLQGADITIGNLEGPLTVRPPIGPPWRYCLRGHPDYAPLLRASGFRVLSLANNHIMDYGWSAVEDTLTSLTEVGIQFVGVGRNLAAARQPVNVSVRGRVFSFLAYCSVPVDLPYFYATAAQPGVAPAEPSHIFEDIRAARRKCDTLVVCMHWGQEHVHYPVPSHRRLAREMIAAGANLILGHHPHVLQGIERVEVGLVVYSLGNFTFADEEWRGVDREGSPFRMQYRLGEPSRRSALIHLDVSDESRGLSFHLIPTYLRPDLCIEENPRAERVQELERYASRLNKRGYPLFWAAAMLWSRVKVVTRGIFSEKGLIWRRLRRLRPRHVRDLVRLLAREWEQLRGVE